MREFMIDNTKVILGENAVENWKILDTSEHKFIWVHLKSFPSGHVIIYSNNPTIDLILQAGCKCRDNTKYKNLRNLKISYTNCGNVKKTDVPGEVTFVSNRKVKNVKL